MQDAADITLKLYNAGSRIFGQDGIKEIFQESGLNKHMMSIPNADAILKKTNLEKVDLGKTFNEHVAKRANFMNTLSNPFGKIVPPNIQMKSSSEK